MPFSGFQDFTPEFGSALQRFIAASPGITVNSGYRTPERQAELYQAAIQKYGSPEAARKWVAPPGSSRHNMRIAADLGFRDEAARRWAHENAAAYGLNFRMGHEPWHIELLGGGGSSPTSPAATDTGAVLADAVQAEPASFEIDMPRLGAQEARQPRLVRRGTQTPPVPEIAPASAAAAPAPQKAPALPTALPPLGQLAELFTINKGIGQAGEEPADRDRRRARLPTIGYG